MARPALSDEERSQRRGQLLAAARPLFHASRDLPSVAAIAEAAGVAKGSIYLSFSSKEHIFIALLEESFGTLLFQLSPHVSAFSRTPGASLSACGRSLTLRGSCVPCCSAGR